MALFLLAFPDSVHIASLGVFHQIFSRPFFGAFLMLLGVASAIVGLSIHHLGRLRMIFFLLQYFFLLTMAASSLSQDLQGRYADGVVRPWQFILLDQLSVLLIPILYTAVIIDWRKQNDT